MSKRRQDREDRIYEAFLGVCCSFGARGDGTSNGVLLMTFFMTGLQYELGSR